MNRIMKNIILLVSVLLFFACSEKPMVGDVWEWCGYRYDPFKKQICMKNEVLDMQRGDDGTNYVKYKTIESDHYPRSVGKDDTSSVYTFLLGSKLIKRPKRGDFIIEGNQFTGGGDDSIKLYEKDM